MSAELKSKTRPCDMCGQPVPQRAGPGRPRTSHSGECRRLYWLLTSDVGKAFQEAMASQPNEHYRTMLKRKTRALLRQQANDTGQG